MTAGLDYSQRPILVFWETTRACALACRHCRASAVHRAPPGELTAAEGREVVRQVAEFGRPSPIVVLTGGDCLERDDAFDLAAYATSLGIPVCMSPSVTPRLNGAAITRMKEVGVRAVSISLDGATGQVHDGVRGVPGHFRETMGAISRLVTAGLRVQVNTTVLRDNVDELGAMADVLRQLGSAHLGGVLPGSGGPRRSPSGSKSG